MNRTFSTSLVSRMGALMALSMAAFAYGAYRLIVLPTVNELALSQMGGVAQQVQGKIDNILGGVETSLRTGRSWGQNSQALPTAANVARFTEVFIPVINQHPEISSVIFADENGREILLLRQPDGALITRTSDPARNGTRMDWRNWTTQGALASSEQRQIEYDARTRPWFQGAMAQATDSAVFWTAPYIFFTSREPGITAAMRWTDAHGVRAIIAMDVALLDLSRFTSKLQIGQRGIVALLDAQGQILAAPHSAQPISDSALSGMALKPAHASAFAALVSGYGQWKSDGAVATTVTRFEHNRQAWLGVMTPTRVGSQPGWLAAYAPADEFLPAGTRAIFLLLGITFLAIAVVSWLALRMARHMALPLQMLARESERIGHLELDAPVTVNRAMSRFSEVRQLGAALNTMRQRLLEATESLARGRQELEMRVTERTQALAHHVVLVEALLDTIPNAIFYKGADSRFLGCNVAYETIFGVQRAEFIGKTVLDLDYLPLAVREAYQAEDLQVIAQGSRVARSEDLRFSDGLVHNTLYAVNGFRNPDGTPAGLIGIVVDVTELKTAEQAAIKASEAALAAADAKALFLANMSHEIRTPMNAILGLTQLVLQMELPDRQRGYLDKVNSAAQGLLVLINDILDFSKIEAGKMMCERAEFSMDKVIEGLTDVLSLRSRDKGLELLFDIDPAVPERLVGDAVRLGQVLTNLVSNAIKFTEQGDVTVDIQCLSHTPEHAVLRFSVHDTGVGMTPDEITRIFSAFTQADSSTTRRFGGTGLGLSISKHIVELMGGAIAVQSTPGVGSMFSFDATFGLTLQPQRAKPDVGSLALRGLRALIVDDNAAARVVFEHTLQGLGLGTHTVGHGEAALAELARAQASAEPYQLLLLDWRMPQMDGLQTLRKMQQTLGPAMPRCIMATAYDPDGLRDELGATQVDAIVQKPATAKLLLQAIHTAMHGNLFSPLANPPHRAAHTTGSVKQRLDGAHVLLVEDNLINQEVATELLAAVGVTADLANDGKEALQRLAQRAYTLVLMDCQMPVMDGFEATRRLRLLPELANLPVIAMTASAMVGEHERCLAAGMSDYLSKPIDLDVFYAKLVYWAALANGGSVPTDPGTPVSTHSTFPPSKRSNNRADDSLGPHRVDEPPGARAILDEASALVRTSGNVALYDRLLHQFNQREADSPARLDAALQAGDLDTALHLMHNLKGVAGTIGAYRLSAACLGLETVLHQGGIMPLHTASPELRRWRSEMALVLEILRTREADRTDRADSATSSRSTPSAPAAEATAAAPNHPAASPQLLAERCHTLEQLLRANDTRANRMAQSLGESLRGTIHAQAAQEIARHAAHFDYDAALQALTILSEHVA